MAFGTSPARRLLFAPADTVTTDIRDLIDSTYDTQDPWRDFCISRGQINVEKYHWSNDDYLFSTILVMEISEIKNAHRIIDNLDNFALAIMWQDDDHVIHGVTWTDAVIANLKAYKMTDYKRYLEGYDGRTMPLRIQVNSERVDV